MQDIKMVSVFKIKIQVSGCGFQVKKNTGNKDKMQDIKMVARCELRVKK